MSAASEALGIAIVREGGGLDVPNVLFFFLLFSGTHARTHARKVPGQEALAVYTRLEGYGHYILDWKDTGHKKLDGKDSGTIY